MGNEARVVGSRFVPGIENGSEDIRERDDAIRQWPDHERPAADSIPAHVRSTACLRHGKMLLHNYNTSH